MSKTTIKMKAYVAIQRKLLCLTYTLWKRNEAYDANYDTKQSNPDIDKKVGGVNPPTQDELPSIAVGSPLSIPQI